MQLNSDSIPSEEFNTICKQTRLWHYEVVQIIKRKQAENKITQQKSNENLTNKNNQKQNIQTMANVDIKLGTSLIQPYDGAPELLDAWMPSAFLKTSSTRHLLKRQ